jgi:hypothetical protein
LIGQCAANVEPATLANVVPAVIDKRGDAT